MAVLIQRTHCFWGQRSGGPERITVAFALLPLQGGVRHIIFFPPGQGRNAAPALQGRWQDSLQLCQEGAAQDGVPSGRRRQKNTHDFPTWAQRACP